MIRSMTAFAREQTQDDWGSATWELRSVNYRYLDVAVRLPEDLRQLEPAIRERAGGRLGRGKVECTLRFQPSAEPGGEFSINVRLAKRLAAAGEEVAEMMAASTPMTAMEILRWPGVMESPEVDAEQLGPRILALFDRALDGLVQTREREGDKLGALVRDRCADMETVVASVKARLPAILEGQRERIHARLAELPAEVDESRLEQEIVLIAQKIDVAEELDRLETHIVEVRRNLSATKPVGRRLDFLMQELNREANTLGSKSVDVETTQASVELKVLIEQMREQIQNIE